jgi:hypothetical protein
MRAPGPGASGAASVGRAGPGPAAGACLTAPCGDAGREDSVCGVGGPAGARETALCGGPDGSACGLGPGMGASMPAPGAGGGVSAPGAGWGIGLLAGARETPGCEGAGGEVLSDEVGGLECPAGVRETALCGGPEGSEAEVVPDVDAGTSMRTPGPGESGGASAREAER